MRSTDPAGFLESRFAPNRHALDSFTASVERGRRAMAARRVVICGLARNVASVLPTTIARIERQGAQFADYRVVLYQNDSQDETLELLEDWRRRNPRVTILSDTLGDPVNRPVRCLERASRMAKYRNTYREFVAANFPDFDHVMVVDTDLAGGWSYDGVAHTFGQPDWDFVGSYGVIYKRMRWTPNVMLHYDAWAYRPFGSYAAMTTKVANRLSWQRGEPLVPVYSCFGGVGLYRTEALVRCHYEGTDVEHVALHRSMREKGMTRHFLNPSQIVVYGRKRRRFDGVLLGMLKMVHHDEVLFESPTSSTESSE
jgi:hypothetical protein